MVTTALIRCLDGSGSKQRGQQKSKHVQFPAVGCSAETAFERLAGAGILVAVFLLAGQERVDLLADLGVGIGNEFLAILDDQTKALLTGVEDIGQGFQIDRFQHQFGVALVDGTSPQLQFRVQVRYDLDHQLLDDFAEALPQIGTIPRHASEQGRALFQCINRLASQAILIAQDGVLFVLKAGCLVRADLVLRPQLVVFLDHLARCVKLGHEIIDVGIQGEHPVDVILVSRLAAIVSDRCDSSGHVIIVVGHTNIDRQVAFIQLRTLDC